MSHLAYPPTEGQKARFEGGRASLRSTAIQRTRQFSSASAPAKMFSLGVGHTRSSPRPADTAVHISLYPNTRSSLSDSLEHMRREQRKVSIHMFICQCLLWERLDSYVPSSWDLTVSSSRHFGSNSVECVSSCLASLLVRRLVSAVAARRRRSVASGERSKEYEVGESTWTGTDNDKVRDFWLACNTVKRVPLGCFRLQKQVSHRSSRIFESLPGRWRPELCSVHYRSMVH